MRALKIVLRTISHILSVVLCLLLMATTLATMFVADIRVATNKDNLQKVLNEVLFAPPKYTMGPITGSTTVGPELDIGALLSGEGDLSEMLVEYAFEMLEDQDIPIEKEAIEAFVEESTLKEFIADKSSSIISDIMTGSNTTTITGEEIKELMTENKELLKEHFDIEVSDEQIDQITEMVEELPVVQEIQKNGVAGFLAGNTTPDSGNTDESPDGDLPTAPGASSNPLAELQRIIAIVSSDALLFSCIGACAFLIALLFLLAWNKPYIAMIYSGITVFITGLIFLVPTLIATYAAGTWMALFSNISDMGAMIGGVSRIVLMLTSSVCICVTGLGLVLFVVGIVVFALMKKAKKAKAAKAAVSPFATVEEAPAVEETPAVEAIAAEAVEEAPDAEEAAPAGAEEVTNA